MNIAIWGISSHRHTQLLPAPPSTPGYWLLVSGLASAHPKDIDRPRSSITVSVPADGGFLVSVMWCSDATCFRFTLSCESQQHFGVLDVTSTKWDHTHATTTQMYVFILYIYIYILQHLRNPKHSKSVFFAVLPTSEFHTAWVSPKGLHPMARICWDVTCRFRCAGARWPEARHAELGLWHSQYMAVCQNLVPL
jgi:hypothetical protein